MSRETPCTRVRMSRQRVSRAGSITASRQTRSPTAGRPPRGPEPGANSTGSIGPAPPPGVRPLPQRRQACRPAREADPRHRRQLRHPQAPQGPRLAGAPPALGVPLHPDFGVLDQCRRGLLLHPDTPTPEARRVPLRCRPRSGYCPHHPQVQRCLTAVRLDQARRHHPRQARPLACTFRLTQCTRMSRSLPCGPCRASLCACAR